MHERFPVFLVLEQVPPRLWWEWPKADDFCWVSYCIFTEGKLRWIMIPEMINERGEEHGLSCMR